MSSTLAVAQPQMPHGQLQDPQGLQARQHGLDGSLGRHAVPVQAVLSQPEKLVSDGDAAPASVADREVRPPQQPKEQQLDLFADRTSTHSFRANQLRLLMTSFAYVLVEALRRGALQHTSLARATVGSIRLKLLKIGAQITLSVRRIKVAMASGCPYQREFRLAWAQIPP